MLLRNLALATVVLSGVLLLGCGSKDDEAPAPGSTAPAANGRSPEAGAAEGNSGAPVTPDDNGK